MSLTANFSVNGSHDKDQLANKASVYQSRGCVSVTSLNQL